MSKIDSGLNSIERQQQKLTAIPIEMVLNWNSTQCWHEKCISAPIPNKNVFSFHDSTSYKNAKWKVFTCKIFTWIRFKFDNRFHGGCFFVLNQWLLSIATKFCWKKKIVFFFVCFTVTTCMKLKSSNKASVFFPTIVRSIWTTLHLSSPILIVHSNHHIQFEIP